MISAASIARMKRGSLFVNVSRGTLVDSADLIGALRDGTLAAAGMDVTDPEPLPPDSPLRSMPNVLVTAHIASVSPASVMKLRTQVAETAAIALRGGRLPNVVNGVSV